MSTRGEKSRASRGVRGQVTVFIIIALLIVGVAVLIYFLTSSTRTEAAFSFDVDNPQGFLQNCLNDELESVVETISLQGGSYEPEFFYQYQGENIEYLCYTNECYKECVVQQPALVSHLESEIKSQIEDDVSSCLNSLKGNYESRNYDVQISPGQTIVELLPKRVALTINFPLTVTRGESQRYESFNVVLNNNLYELSSIANSIIDWETNYGDIETTTYMGYYRDLKVEKNKQDDGSKIYILTDRNTENKFQFASRSIAGVPGYCTEVATS
jgi:hypothetical protein